MTQREVISSKMSSKIDIKEIIENTSLPGLRAWNRYKIKMGLSGEFK